MSARLARRQSGGRSERLRLRDVLRRGQDDVQEGTRILTRLDGTAGQLAESPDNLDELAELAGLSILALSGGMHVPSLVCP